MQTFRTRFTADVSQHRRAMGEFRAQTCAAVQEARNQILSLGALSIGGLGVKDLVKDVILLGGEMQQTETAFEVMLGSAEKGRAAIAKLIGFADVTPFDNPEIIRSGKSLLNIGIAVDGLTGKLEMLGNISAGTGNKIFEITSIYSKAAAKGKVQTEELMQLAERGVPIIQAFASMLKVPTQEVMAMAEKGQLSFALLDEALQSLGGQGGKYFGLMEKQSKNMLGAWSNFQAEVEKIGTAIGKKAIPELTGALESLLAEIDKLRESGELDQMISGAGKLIGETASALKDFVAFIVANRETIASLGMSAAGLLLILKAKQILLELGGGLVFMVRAAAQIDSAAQQSAANAAGAVGTVRKSLTGVRNFMGGMKGVMVSPFAAAKMAAANFGAVAATAFIGWEIGKRIGDMLQLEKAFTRLFLKAKGMSDEEIEEHMNPKKVDVSNMDADALKKRREALIGLAKEAKRIEDAEKRLEAGTKEFGYVRDESEVLPERRAAYAAYKKDQEEYIKEYKFLEGWKRKKNKFIDEINAIDARRRQLEAEEAKKKKPPLEKPADKPASSAAQDAIAAREKEKREKELAEKKKLAEKERELNHSIAKEQKENAKSGRDLADAQNRDFVTQKIQGWRDEIAKYQKDIESAEKMLRRFGATLEDDILKTPEQIAQERKDNILRQKIDAYNQGAKVTFTKEEQARILEMQNAQNKARKLMADKEMNEGYINDAEKSLNAYDRRREIEERNARANELKNRSAALKAAEDQLRIAKEANQPMEAVLKKIEEILKYGLPNQTV
nr:MAG TPA: tail tape measure protein [Caudoviricetes sp.]